MLYTDLELSRLLVREHHQQLKRDAARRTRRTAPRLRGTVRIAKFEILRTTYLRWVHGRLAARS